MVDRLVSKTSGVNAPWRFDSSPRHPVFTFKEVIIMSRQEFENGQELNIEVGAREILGHGVAFHHTVKWHKGMTYGGLHETSEAAINGFTTNALSSTSFALGSNLG